MNRTTHFKRLAIAAFGIGGIVVACHATSPEAPPLAPRPDPSTPANPVPSGPADPGSEPGTPGPTFPPADAGGPSPMAPPPTPMPNPMPKNNGPISGLQQPSPIASLRTGVGASPPASEVAAARTAEQMQVVDAGLRDAQVAPDAVPKLDAAIPVDAAKPVDALLPPPADAGRPIR